MVVVGSQDVIAAKCCPGHSLAAQEEKEKDKVGRLEKEYRVHLKIQKVFQVSKSRLCSIKRHISEKQEQVVHF